MTPCRLLVVAAILSLAVPRWSYGISIYDVIQLSEKGYSDDDVITLIEATGSVFELEAEDIPRLKREGVSEAVIRTMVAAVAEHPNEEENASSEPPEHEHREKTDAHIEHADGGKPGHGPPPVFGDPGSGVFGSHAVDEYRGGIHRHQAVTLRDVVLLVLRDEAGHQTLTGRAGAVVRRLQAAWSQGPGTFRPASEHGAHSVVFHSRDGRVSIVVISVSRGDAVAYQRRSDRPVTSDLLAAYWSDLLSDYWSLAQGETATQLVALHGGDALQVLSEAVAGTNTEDAEPFAAAVRSSPGIVREHLRQLATTVPAEFAHGAHEVQVP